MEEGQRLQMRMDDYYRFLAEQFPENIRFKPENTAETDKTDRKMAETGNAEKEVEMKDNGDNEENEEMKEKEEGKEATTAAPEVEWLDPRVLGADWLGVFQRLAPTAHWCTAWK